MWTCNCVGAEMELDILTLSQQMKSSFMLACTFHMQKNIVRISFISTSNGNKPAKKEILPPFFSTTSINERRNFIWEAKKKKKFSHEKCFFFLYSELKWKTKKKTEMLSGTNSITIITPPWVVPHNTQHTGLGTKKVWGDTHPLNTKSQISSWLFICTYVCTYLDMKNLIKIFYFTSYFRYISLTYSQKKTAHDFAKW